MPVRPPELLAPAGDAAAMLAAIQAGADAVYFGLDEGLNARARARNFALDDLPGVCDRLHRAGARAYLTLNTLIFQEELPFVERMIRAAAAAGVDALIVQDPAVALLARAVAPTLEVHASTQMTISSPEAAAFARALGVTRVVVPRELSVGEIAKFAAGTELELEVFVHGALCMSWSGQCLTSEAWGGRSANRGQCAQSCRMPYELMVDGRTVPLGDVQYLLSPKDLAGVDAVPELVRLGVHGLKIEGRQKGPHYVATATAAYRRWVDAVVGEGVTRKATEELSLGLGRMALAYSRGFSQGFLGGADHQTLVDGRAPRHRGRLLGTVVAVEARGVRVERGVEAGSGGAGVGGAGRKTSGTGAGKGEAGSAAGADVKKSKDSGSRLDRAQAAVPLTNVKVCKDSGTEPVVPPRSPRDAETGASPGADPAGESAKPLQPLAQLPAPEPRPGQGVVFDAGRPEDDEPGGPLFRVEPTSDGWRLGFGQPGPDLRRVRVGDRVWLTGDPAESQATDRLLQTGEPEGRVPVDVDVTGQQGQPLRVVLRARGASGKPVEVSATSTSLLQPAATKGITADLLQDKLTAFGGTCFRLDRWDASGLEPGLHLPVAELKPLRRHLVATLLDLHAKAFRHVADPEPAVPRVIAHSRARSQQRRLLPRTWQPPADPQLLPLCRQEEQLEAVIAAGLPEVELDWMELVGLTRAVEKARAAGLRVTVATVRVQKPGEDGFDRRIARLQPDGVLVRHWGGLMHFAGLADDSRPAVHGDFSLNVTNAVTAHELLASGADTLTAAHDLDERQLHSLLDEVPAERLTVVAHHHIATFHTEHCVYSHLLSHGKDFRSCGRPCEQHQVSLRDHLGLAHPVVVDVGCRNTVFNAQAQSAASAVPALLERGVRRFRVELVRETAEQTAQVLAAYRALLQGRLTPAELVRRVQVHEQFGVTPGTMRTMSVG